MRERESEYSQYGSLHASSTSSSTRNRSTRARSGTVRAAGCREGCMCMETRRGRLRKAIGRGHRDVCDGFRARRRDWLDALMQQLVVSCTSICTCASVCMTCQPTGTASLHIEDESTATRASEPSERLGRSSKCNTTHPRQAWEGHRSTALHRVHRAKAQVPQCSNRSLARCSASGRVDNKRGMHKSNAKCPSVPEVGR